MADRGKSNSKNSLLALFFVAILGVMLVPVPSLLLDAMLCLNITSSLLILMAVLNAGRPVEFSTFPSVLLFTALFRLALNVASTRLILLEGDAGDVIKTFGQFVVGGEPLVGIVIFLVLVVIQFIVITKGQGRISEVAARFALDSLPGKQMSIDADLQAGLIDEAGAKSRRARLEPVAALPDAALSRARHQARTARLARDAAEEAARLAAYER